MLERLIKPSGKRKQSEPLVFVHIPKCAGMAVIDSLRISLNGADTFILDAAASTNASSMVQQSSDDNSIWQQTHDFRRYLLAYNLYLKKDFIAGHMSVDRRILEEFASQCSFITILRHPVERFKSHYIYSRLHAALKKEDVTDDLSRMVSSMEGWQMAFTPTLMLTGRYPSNLADARYLANEVQENLKFFRVIAFQDYPENISQLLYEKLKIRISLSKRNVTTENLSPAQESVAKQIKESLADAKVNRAIEDLCAIETENYVTLKEQWLTK